MGPLENGPWHGFPPFPSRFEFRDSKLSLEDVLKVIVEPICLGSSPCLHKCKITLNDGRFGFLSYSDRIVALISELPQEKINPNGECIFSSQTQMMLEALDGTSGAEKGDRKGWTAKKVQEHFGRYNKDHPILGAALDVLRRIPWKHPEDLVS